MICHKFQALIFLCTLAKYLVLHDLILFLTFPNKLARLSLSMSMRQSPIFSQGQNHIVQNFGIIF